MRDTGQRGGCQADRRCVRLILTHLPPSVGLPDWLSVVPPPRRGTRWPKDWNSQKTRKQLSQRFQCAGSDCGCHQPTGHLMGRSSAAFGLGGSGVVMIWGRFRRSAPGSSTAAPSQQGTVELAIQSEANVSLKG